MSDSAVSPGQVHAFLAARHGGAVAGVEQLRAGFWSAAYGYGFDGQDLVVRFASSRDGFDADRQAMAYHGPELPVPEVLEIGEAFGGAYAISVRHHGRFLESVRPDEANVAGPTIVRLLEALRSAQASGAPVDSPPTWRRWLIDALDDDAGGSPVRGWRVELAADTRLDRLYRECVERIGTLVDACPERRDVVHGDLLHGNVLVSPDASRVTAVFSWKCSTLGDFVYDVAWCTFWGAVLYPGIGAAGVWNRMLSRPDAAAGAAAFDAAAARHHCYELHIGARHLGWYAWTGDPDGLVKVAAHVEQLLERGSPA